MVGIKINEFIRIRWLVTCIAVYIFIKCCDIQSHFHLFSLIFLALFIDFAHRSRSSSLENSPHSSAAAVKDRSPKFQDLSEPNIHIVTSSRLSSVFYHSGTPLDFCLLFLFSFKSRLNLHFKKFRLKCRFFSMLVMLPRLQGKHCCC